MNIDKKANQAEFEALLRSVNRDGMDYGMFYKLTY